MLIYDLGLPEALNNCPNCGAALASDALRCGACGASTPLGRELEPEDRITQELSRHADDEHPDVREMLQSGLDDAPEDPAEPEVIVVREPVVIEGGGRHYSHRERASSCYINRSCPTCAPCCLAMFVAPMIFLLWTLYPGWKQSREIARYSSRDASQQAQSQPDPASDRLLSEVREMEFASREELEAFVHERGIAFSRREDGYWIATDRTQQAALVVLQQRWMELPEDAAGDEGQPGDTQSE